MHKLFHGGRTHTPSHINKPLPEPLVDPDEGKTPIGELVIVPIQGRDLPNRERFGKQDPFILFKLGNVSKRSSTDVRGGQRPRWKDEQINIYMYESDAKDATSLYVTCLDEDHQRNDFIGNCVVNLTKVLEQGEHDDWFELTFKGREAGELLLQLTYYSHDPRHPTHRNNRPSNSSASTNSAPARRPVHPTNGPAKVVEKPSTSVSAATTPGSSTVATSTTITTAPSVLNDAPMYRPPAATEPSLSVPAVAGGYYPYSNVASGDQAGRISPLGHDGRVSPSGYSGRVSPSGLDGRASPSGQNGRISPSYQSAGYPSPYHQQHQQQHQQQPYGSMNESSGFGSTGLYPPTDLGGRPSGMPHQPQPGYTPVGYPGYPFQPNHSNGYPPLQPTMNHGYPPIGNPTGYPPQTFPLGQSLNGYPPPAPFPPTGYPPVVPGAQFSGLYPPIQHPYSTTNNPTGPNPMGYPPVGYPFGASNVYRPQAHHPQELVPDNYKEEHRPQAVSTSGSGNGTGTGMNSPTPSSSNNSSSGGDKKDRTSVSKPLGSGSAMAGSSLPGAWPVSAASEDGDSPSSSLGPPALPPRARSSSPPALPPRDGPRR